MQQSVQINNNTISYRLIGQGKPVVLLHGFGEDSHIWDEQIDALQHQYQLILPDIPGSGASATLPIDYKAASIDLFADIIYQLLQHLSITSFVMLGHSMGGYITLAFAEKHPEMLLAFGLIHSTAFADSLEKKEQRQKSIELIGTYGSHAFLKNTIPNLFSNRYKQEQPQQINELIEQSKNFNSIALQQYTYAMQQRADKTVVLKNASVPVLVMIGTDDVAAPMNDVLQQVYLAEESYIHILEQTAHMGMWESTTLFNQHLQAFLAAVL